MDAIRSKLPRGDLETLSAVIDRIYEAAIEPERWPDVVAAMVPAVAASSGQIFTPLHRPDTGGFAIPANIPETFNQRYASVYHQHDVWTHAMLGQQRTASGNVVCDHELMPRRALLSSRYYKEFLAPADASRLCVAMIFGHDAPDLRMTIFSAYRPVGARPFPVRARRWMSLLTPHLSRALGVMYRLQNAEFQVSVTHAALDRLNAGVVLLGAQGEVVFANRRAAQIVGEGRGLQLARGADGLDRLAVAGSQAAALREAVATALDRASLEVEHFSRGLRIDDRDGRGALMISVSALPADNSLGRGIGAPHAIVFITDAAAPVQVSAQLLRDLYALTPAEIRLVESLCSGATLAETATTLSVSEETVRSQLKSVFTKTSTNRQADLVRLVVSLSSSRT